MRISASLDACWGWAEAAGSASEVDEVDARSGFSLAEVDKLDAWRGSLPGAGAGASSAGAGGNAAGKAGAPPSPGSRRPHSASAS